MYENPFAGSDDIAENENEIENDGKMDVEHTTQTNTHTPSITTESSTMSESGSKIQDPSENKNKRMDRGDSYVLHFYDLAARKPHSLYEFVKAWRKSSNSTVKWSVAKWSVAKCSEQFSW